ncbi:MAG: L-lysine 6-transaminase [Deltaproteobacteria bacterium RIFCSPLOWO2_01_44_7]|nr:MAG: L-lysine 6-transaminase [Deltaproteobacteria bacterium RIFCSPHIGHO2_01_FULL_43_49]OGQ15158.1 MAG: L-lysine 6-transaminase [Deltaproteobacteria bacterium RIFCSPHIGHO2_02_FULL_44_53]OGQ27221.1 MAG: L-lysine 6-transaminase [Deltaproteobacteria bacterium RIFCSPHIGHO2_12_FULL_44_21]OGQ31675.1 MAG: L-lysine 6-transaminase [Deltaproteobacteria bacterium RIFCSPLOWO2_01_FULL_45_74]OGQ38554.1 MAG: L-lysine 6-transaminase [Deltaproteobacteria bacterium RIFCSPLOWO2_01_44_7]OGQ42875.1 MAG: L-lysine
MKSVFTKDYSGKKALETLKRSILVDGFHVVIDLKKSKGAHVYNELDKKMYLDFYSFFGSLPIGFNHPGLKNKSYQNALNEVSQIKVALSDVYSSHFARFVDVFNAIAIRKHFRYLFFVEGGALAVENALKVAFDWKTRLNVKRGLDIEASQIIHFQQGFHGRTGYTICMTDSPDLRKTQYFPKFPWPRILNPKINVYEEELHPSTVEERERKALQQIRAVLNQLGLQTAAIIIEPIQSEGGDNHFRPEFLKKLREIADQNDILLIFDEVQTGLGLSGEWWCWENFGVKPDIMTFGKKVQVGGIAVTDRIDKEGIDHCFKISSRINSTFGGNLVDMVRATRYIEIIKEYGLLKNIRERGGQFLKGFIQLSHTYPLTNIRGLGGILAFDVPSEEVRQKILRTAIERERLLILPSGKRSVRFRPSLSITKAEVEEGLQRLEKTLKQVFLYSISTF